MEKYTLASYSCLLFKLAKNSVYDLLSIKNRIYRASLKYDLHICNVLKSNVKWVLSQCKTGCIATQGKPISAVKKHDSSEFLMFWL